jgi:hypothetical protein
LKPTDITTDVMRKLVSLSVITDGERNVSFARGATEILENLLLGGEGGPRSNAEGKPDIDIGHVLLVVVYSMDRANLYNKDDILGQGFDEWYDGVKPT